MNKIHEIKDVKVKKNFLFITVDGKKIKIDLTKFSNKIANADEKTKNNFIISPSGYGIHWPDLDEDLSIDGLLGIKHEPKKKREKILA